MKDFRPTIIRMHENGYSEKKLEEANYMEKKDHRKIFSGNRENTK
jgi:hypothetical protein